MAALEVNADKDFSACTGISVFMVPVGFTIIIHSLPKIRRQRDFVFQRRLLGHIKFSEITVFCYFNKGFSLV